MSAMSKTQERAALLQGTLDILILRTLLYDPAHGHQIAKHIQKTTNDFLRMQHGSLYAALHRLGEKGWVSSKWGNRSRSHSRIKILSADRARQEAARARTIKVGTDGRGRGTGAVDCRRGKLRGKLR